MKNPRQFLFPNSDHEPIDWGEFFGCLLAAIVIGAFFWAMMAVCSAVEPIAHLATGVK